MPMRRVSPTRTTVARTVPLIITNLLFSNLVGLVINLASYCWDGYVPKKNSCFRFDFFVHGIAGMKQKNHNFKSNLTTSTFLQGLRYVYR